MNMDKFQLKFDRKTVHSSLIYILVFLIVARFRGFFASSLRRACLKIEPEDLLSSLNCTESLSAQTIHMLLSRM